jgi:hypothetical protein
MLSLENALYELYDIQLTDLDWRESHAARLAIERIMARLDRDAPFHALCVELIAAREDAVQFWAVIGRIAQAVKAAEVDNAE